MNARQVNVFFKFTVAALFPISQFCYGPVFRSDDMEISYRYHEQS